MSDQEYDEQLARLVGLSPNHLLLNKLRQGNTIVNQMLLLRALSEIELNPVSEMIAIEKQAEDDPVEDETLRMLRVRQRKLFSERQRLSDNFHKCKTNQQRGWNSEDIQIVQRNIERNMQQIRHYKLHGVLQEDENSKEYIPKDGYELGQRKRSLQANISRQKKIVRELEEVDTDDPAHLRKLEKSRDRLLKLKTQLKDVQEKIKNL